MATSASPLLFALTVIFPFLALAWILAPEWELHPHYAFGWLMPFLTGFLLWKRWQDRPPAGPPLDRSIRTVLFLIGGLAWPILLVLHASNPDWRLVLWAGAALFSVVMSTGLASVGGLPWLRHFAFPTVFYLLAIPWPSGLETTVVTTLMQWVAAACVESLNWFGHVAWQQGNLIKLPQGTIGVDEACSGIRSLQANLMAALFVGELYRRSLPARCFLVLGGLFLSLLLNFLRALALALLWIHHGNPAMDTWHDPAGHGILILSFVILLALGRKPLTEKVPGQVVSAPGCWPSRALCFTFIGLILMGPVLANLWFIFRSPGPQSVASSWTLTLPEGASVQSPVLPPSVTAMLRYDRGEHRLWSPSNGTLWSLFDFEWNPGKHSARLARAHSPEICLPAAGAQMVPHGPMPLTPRGADQPLFFEQFEARIGGKILHVFYLRWQETPDPVGSPLSPLDRRERLRMAWLGRREQRQRVIQLMTEGYPNLAAAREAVRTWLSNHLAINSPK
ncbi:MAG: hypothetical protein OHK005_06830 [Candidatus Methylacidiphilales bacterium]